MEAQAMNMNRRSFLKGLMAVAGVAAVGLPPTGANYDSLAGVALDDSPQYILSNKPRGAYGSIRIDGTWYALDDGRIDMCQELREFSLGSRFMCCAPTVLSWSIDCDFTDALAVLAPDLEEHDMEIDIDGAVFGGKVYYKSISSNISVTGDLTFSVRFMGTGALARIA